MILGEDGGHPLASLQADPHRRHQKLHCYLRCNLAFANLPLDRFRQRLHQRQPPRYPAHAAVEPARQLIEAIAEALLQLGQEPPHFQCGFVFRHAQGTVQHNGLGFAHRPHHRFHFVAAKLLKRRDALVAVDYNVTVWLPNNRDHHDGRLLAALRHRGQQPPLPPRMVYSQVLPTKIELMKLKLHQNRLNVKANLAGGSISSALKPRLFPSALPFTDALHRVPASVRAIVLQGTSPLACESLVATRSVARMLEKNVPE